MFIIEYWQYGQLQTITTSDPIIACAIEDLLFKLQSVMFVMVWGPI